jgi:hypothetical protein
VAAQRIILYDRTCTARAGLGLSTVWRGGAALYRVLARAHASFGATSFANGLSQILAHRADDAISELSFWGHGKWGQILVARDGLDRRAFAEGHPLHRDLCELRERLAPSALVWLRTCETFGAAAGHDFARRAADFFRCRVAGHSYVIGYYQSGLHVLRPGCAPHWSDREGLVHGSPERPEMAARSSPREPNTVTCLSGCVPDGW